MNRRTLGRIAAAAAVILTLSGCMKVNVDLTLKSNNTVDGTMILAMNQSLAQLAGQDPKTLADELNKQVLTGDDGPKNARTEAYSDGTFVGTKITFLDEPISTFDGSSSTPSASPTDSSTGADDLKITRDGDDFLVSGSLDTSEALATLDDSGTDMSALANGAELRVAITFPGEVKEHNGVLKDRTVTWTPKVGDKLAMHARGSAEGASSIPWWAIAVGALVLLALLGGLITWLILRGRRKAVPVQAEGMAPGVDGPPILYAPDPSVAGVQVPPVQVPPVQVPPVAAPTLPQVPAPPVAPTVPKVQVAPPAPPAPPVPPVPPVGPPADVPFAD